MADRLYIEGNRVDLYEGDQAGMNFAVNNLGDMTDREGGFSYSLKIPKTDNNISIFGYTNSLSSNTRKAFEKIACQYYSGAVQLVGSGYCVINDAGRDFNISIYSGNTSLFNKIEGLKLSDLDLSAYDMMWDFAGIASMYSNTASPTCVLLDNGHVLSTGNEIEASEMFFQLFWSTVLEQIFIDAGFTFDGSMFSDEEYTRALFPFVNEIPKQGLPEIEESKTKAVNTTTEILTPTPTGTYSTVPLTFADDSVDGYDVNGNLNVGTGIYTVPHKGKIKVKGHLVVYVNDMLPVTGTLCYVQVMVNAVQVATSETLLHENANDNANNYLDFELFVDVEAGDTIGLEAVTYNPIGHPLGYLVAIVTGDDTTNGKSYFQFDLDEELFWGGMWRFSRNLPDLSQKDFLKMTCQLYGQSFETDEFSSEITFFNLDEVIALRGLDGSFDWSNYLDVGSHSIKYHSTYAKTNECIFSKDDEVTEFLGDSSFAIDDDTLKEKGTAIKVPVAASDTVSRLQGIEMAEVLRFDIDDKPVTPKPRILRRVNTPLNPSGLTENYVRITEAGTANQNDFYNASVGLFTHSFSYMLNRYYTGWIDTLNDYKVVTCNMLIPPSVMQSFSFTKPVYLKQLNSWFYVNKIDNYKSSKLCKVELQRI